MVGGPANLHKVHIPRLVHARLPEPCQARGNSAEMLRRLSANRKHIIPRSGPSSSLDPGESSSVACRVRQCGVLWYSRAPIFTKWHQFKTLTVPSVSISSTSRSIKRILLGCRIYREYSSVKEPHKEDNRTPGAVWSPN